MRNGELERWAVYINHTMRRHERLAAIYPHSSISLFPSAQSATVQKEKVWRSLLCLEAALTLFSLHQILRGTSSYHYPSAPANTRALFLLPTLLVCYLRVPPLA